VFNISSFGIHTFDFSIEKVLSNDGKKQTCQVEPALVA
jgi:hypothetical protein